VQQPAKRQTMALTEISTASTVGLLVALHQLASALPATQALADQTARLVLLATAALTALLIIVSQRAPPSTIALMETSTALTGAVSEERQEPVHVPPAT